MTQEFFETLRDREERNARGYGRNPRNWVTQRPTMNFTATRLPHYFAADSTPYTTYVIEVGAALNPRKWVGPSKTEKESAVWSQGVRPEGEWMELPWNHPALAEEHRAGYCIAPGYYRR